MKLSKMNEILVVEKLFNKKIKEQIDVVTRVLPIDEAKKLGAAMQFGEKYGDIVRVVDVGSWSMEFVVAHMLKTHQTSKTL